MKKAEEKPAVEMTVGGKPKSGASHPPWKSLRDSHIPTARRLLYIFKTFARKEPSSAIASGYGFRLILRLEKTVPSITLRPKETHPHAYRREVLGIREVSGCELSPWRALNA